MDRLESSQQSTMENAGNECDAGGGYACESNENTKTSDRKKEVAIRLKEIIHSISFASHRQLRDFAKRAQKMANATAIAGKSAEILVDFDLGIRYC